LGKDDYLGIGFLSKKDTTTTLKQLMTKLDPHHLNEFVRSLILQHAEEYPEDAVVFN
jgi:hypothetical protein